jgi:hypothetical protein
MVKSSILEFIQRCTTREYLIPILTLKTTIIAIKSLRPHTYVVITFHTTRIQLDKGTQAFSLSQEFVFEVR